MKVHKYVPSQNLVSQKFPKNTLNQLKQHLCLKKDILGYNHGHLEIIFIKFAHPAQASGLRFVEEYNIYSPHISPR